MTTSPDWRCTTCDAHYHCAVATPPPPGCLLCGSMDPRVPGGADAGLRRAQGWESDGSYGNHDACHT